MNSFVRSLSGYAQVCLVLWMAVTVYGQERITGEAPTESLPLSFEQNSGQTDSQVRFLSRAGRYRIYLTEHSAVVKIAGDKGRNTDAVLRTTLPGSKSKVAVRGLDMQHGSSNYLVGPRESWKTGIANFRAVKYEGVYPGINLIYYGKGRELEYDFDIAPRSDPSAIILNVEGSKKITAGGDGSLILETAAGEVRWAKPTAYQENVSGRSLVSVNYQVRKNKVSFVLGPYDRSKQLTIDPVLVYGTYLNGNNWERANSILVDSAGYLYVLGWTSSSDFPTTPGAYQKQVPDSNEETFVAKLTQDGSALVWSTIIGGIGSNNFALPNAFALDASGDVYVVGQTQDRSFDGTTQTFTNYASTFPTTPGAYNTHALATARYFLFKLNNTGSNLLYSTFLSDQPNIIPASVAVDVQGNAYITGVYNQNSGLTAPFPATAGAYQANYGGHDDSFVMKFNPAASGLVYATLIGGPETEDASQIQVDSGGNATINGFTYSLNYPIIPNGKRQTDEGGFITTFNSTGTGLIYSTVLNHVLCINVKRDESGNYYAGGSAGTNLPTTPNAYQRNFPATGTGIHLGFLTEIDTSGNLVYSSYLGGNPSNGWSEDTEPQLVSPDGVTLVGNRYSDPTFPVTDRTYEQDNCSFLAQFNTHASGNSSLKYSGCTPINMTDNLVVEQFRGIPLFTGAQIYLDTNHHLYALQQCRTDHEQCFPEDAAKPERWGWLFSVGREVRSQPA